MPIKNPKAIVYGLACKTVDGRGCTGSRERDIEELIQKWEKEFKEGEK